MNPVPAAYYDGRTSALRRVEIVFYEDGRVGVRGEDIDLMLDYPDLRITSRLGNTPRFIYLPDGARLEVGDNDAIDEAVARLGGYEGHRFLHGIESRYTTALAALILCAGIALGVIQYGIPWLAREVAFAMPPGVEGTLGKEGLATLDRTLFEPSALDDATRGRVWGLFRSLERPDAAPSRVELVLRKSPRVGANAFALPANIIVVTDELVELAQRDEELLGVLAHELGHVYHRHILRQVLQNSLTALLVAGLFGDLSSIAGLSATLPTFLVQQKYTRDFEREADAFAAEMLRDRGVSPAHLARMLKRLSEAHGGPDSEVLGYLSSHPATQERIDALTGPE